MEQLYSASIELVNEIPQVTPAYAVPVHCCLHSVAASPVQLGLVRLLAAYEPALGVHALYNICSREPLESREATSCICLFIGPKVNTAVNVKS